MKRRFTALDLEIIHTLLLLSGLPDDVIRAALTPLLPFVRRRPAELAAIMGDDHRAEAEQLCPNVVPFARSGRGCIEYDE